MSAKPCTNPSCPSYGKPHPNCRCAEGFALGGEVPASDLPTEGPEPTAEPMAGIGEEVPPEDMPSDGEVPASDMPGAPQESTFSGKALAATEGAAQGVLGGAAPWLEAHNPFILIDKAEEKASFAGQKATQEASPATFEVAKGAGQLGSLLTGVGQAGMAEQAAVQAAKYLNLSTKGASILASGLTNGVIQGSDEVSKMLLGQGDPADGVGSALLHMGGAMMVGLGLGGIGSFGKDAAMKGLAALSEKKYAAKFVQSAQSYLAGIAHASEGVAATPPEGVSKAVTEAYNRGYRYFHRVVDSASPLVGGIEGAKKGYEEHGIVGAAVGAPLGAFAGLFAGIPIRWTSHKIASTAVPAVAKLLSSGKVTGLANTLDYASSVSQGHGAITKAVDALFKGLPLAALKAGQSYNETDGKKIDDWIEKGGVNSEIQSDLGAGDQAAPAFAKGGKVAPIEPQDDGGNAAHVYPDQNALMGAVRGRVSQYLTGLKPQKAQPKLAFDPPADDRQQKRTYQQALKVAAHPMGVLEEIHKGTIQPDQIKHLNSMYPEVVQLMQKKLTQRVTKAQEDGEKPSFKVRQGLSMLLGTPLSGEMQPQNIQAAQAVFASKSPPAPTKAPSQSSTKSLSKSDQAYLTGSQSLQRRAQKT